MEELLRSVINYYASESFRKFVSKQKKRYERKRRFKRIEQSLIDNWDNYKLIDIVSEQTPMFSFVEHTSINLTGYDTFSLDQEKSKKWIELISVAVGHSIEYIGLLTASDGLVRCNLDLNALCMVKDAPNLLRGYVLENGRISKHATFDPDINSLFIGSLCMKSLSFITSQYYLHYIHSNISEVKESLQRLEEKVDYINWAAVIDDLTSIMAIGERLTEILSNKALDKNDIRDVHEYSTTLAAYLYKYIKIIDKYKMTSTSGESNYNEVKSRLDAFYNSYFWYSIHVFLYLVNLYYVDTSLFLLIAINQENSDNMRHSFDRLNKLKNILIFNFQPLINKIYSNLMGFIDAEISDAHPDEKKKILDMRKSLNQGFTEIKNAVEHLCNYHDTEGSNFIKISNDGKLCFYLKNCL
ncbi:MAG: hypothetical protein HDS31_03465 [Bacteroides sp.]|nr:hypothetical protein [Bacteroides sp.]